MKYRESGDAARWTAWLALAITFAACRGPVPDARPRIVLERAQTDGIWQATYHLAEPASRLRFSRQAGFYREDVWEIVTPGWRFDRVGEDQVLVADQGALSDTIVVRFPVYTENLPKEYELFAEFTDGSVAIYTGHLYVTTADAPADGADDAVFLQRLELVANDGEKIVVQGIVGEDRVVWEDPHGDGTYVYFGGIEPLETDSMIGIVDPGAPRWLVEQLNRMLPAFFAAYTERFGEQLPWKPIVLFSFVDIDRPGLSSGGGTLTGLIQMSATGHEWHEATPESSEHLLYLIAHEAAHLWNGQLHPYEDSADSWMHEGSADAFAELVLLDAGAIDSNRLAERRTEALNLCVRGLRDGSLATSNQPGRFQNYYACGNLIAVWSVAATPKASGSDLYGIWRALFARSDPEEGSYDRATYFAALEAAGVAPGRIRDLQELIDSEHRDPAARWIEFFGDVGIDLEVMERPIPSLRRRYASAALSHLMAENCDGHVSYYNERDRLRTAVMEDCEPFRDELKIVAIEGYPMEDGDLALEATHRRCGEGEAVTVGLEAGGTARIPCATPPPPEPPPLRFPQNSRLRHP
ncbi:MAG: hypothetical protein R3344_03905 [Acidobacteriota bacterium]|nr:hypothetical protein [Acidobacteriota bacterium]